MAYKKIIFNGSVFEHNGNYGIATFFSNMFNKISNDIDVTLWLGAESKFMFPKNIKIIRDDSRGYFKRFDIVSRIKKRFDKVWLNYRVYGFDIFHSVYDDFYNFAKINVCTVHDIIPELFYDHGSWALEQLIKKEILITKVDFITVPSEATKCDFEKYYKKKVTAVIPYGHEHIQNVFRKFDELQNYFVYCGQRGSYKNFMVLAKAAALIIKCIPDFKVSIIGPKFSIFEKRILDYLDVRKCFLEFGFVSDEIKFSIIGSSLGLIYPSLLEGFGFPILEGQKLGVPVYMSDIPSSREVSGNKGVFFDPGNYFCLSKLYVLLQ